MTEQMIPADKVRELADKYDQDSSGNPERLLVQAIADLRALLPAPPQPTTGLLGRWAKHPDYGDVMCVWDKPKDGWINIYKRANNGVTGAEWYQIRFSDLTFPHQATKPEDVPAGEAWLVEQLGEGEQHAFKTAKDEWQTSSSDPSAVYNIPDSEVTLVCQLVPERPVSDLQAKYDALQDENIQLTEKYSLLDATYEEAKAFIERLKQEHRELQADFDNCQKSRAHLQDQLKSATDKVVYLTAGYQPAHPAPAWRIEYDHTNLRVGEYVIDKDDDDGTVKNWDHYIDRWFVLGGALAIPDCAPFIVFPNRDAATPEAVAEAKKARDKETGE